MCEQLRQSWHTLYHGGEGDARWVVDWRGNYSEFLRTASVVKCPFDMGLHDSLKMLPCRLRCYTKLSLKQRVVNLDYIW
jgi:hypothetical protein